MNLGHNRRSSYPESEREGLVSSPSNAKPRPGNAFDGGRHAIYKDCAYVSYNYTRVIESQIFSSLALQKLIYFRSYLSVVFMYMLLYVYIWKYWIFAFDAWHLVRLILIWPWALFEIGRLYSGYHGNIKESFPDLISFLVLTVLALLNLIALIAFPKWMPIERALLIIAIVFTVIEFIMGVIALSKMVRSQTAMFFLRSPQTNSKLQQDKEDRDQREIEMRILQEEKDRQGQNARPSSRKKPATANGPKKKTAFTSQGYSPLSHENPAE